MKLKFSQRIFEKKTQISNFMTISPVGAQLFMLTEGRTDGHEGFNSLIVINNLLCLLTDN